MKYQKLIGPIENLQILTYIRLFFSYPFFYLLLLDWYCSKE